MTPRHTGRALSVTALLAVSLTAAPTASAVADAPEQLRAKFIANLVAHHSGKCLDVSGGDTADGAKVQQWTCGGWRNQEWNLVATSNGYYTIRAGHSGKCLDVYGAGTVDGTKVLQWTCNGAANQEWRLDQRDNGYFTIVARHSGKCLDVSGRGQADGVVVHQWTCGGWPNQEWRLA
jgi:hypothetical protein